MIFIKEISIIQTYYNMFLWISRKRIYHSCVPNDSLFQIRSLILFYFQCGLVHTEISWQNIFHSTIIPPCRVSREAVKLKKLFYLFGLLFFRENANGITLKNPKIKSSKSIKKLLLIGIFLEFFQFWLENSSPNWQGELDWIIPLLLTPEAFTEEE